MTDIVERLRASAAETRAKAALVEQFKTIAVPPLMDEMQRSANSVNEAADEIERLRAQVVALQSSLEVGKREGKKTP